MEKGKKDITLISLGGSLINSSKGIEDKFLKNLRALILRHVRQGKRFIFVTGGGVVCREYMEAAKRVAKSKNEDLDWIGIYMTRVNASLVRTMFGPYAHPRIVENPTAKIDFKEKILVGGGWMPGASSDIDAVLLAKKFSARTIINLSNIKYVYDKDPKKYKDAKPFKHIPWAEFRKLVGSSWKSGMHAPFDPIASREAEKAGLKVVVANGDLKNLDKILSGKDFKGTVIG